MTIKASKQSRRRYSPAVNRARATLKKRGWTYPGAAPLLGVHPIHIAKVLTGKRESKALLKRISELPENKAA